MKTFYHATRKRARIHFKRGQDFTNLCLRNAQSAFVVSQHLLIELCIVGHVRPEMGIPRSTYAKGFIILETDAIVERLLRSK